LNEDFFCSMGNSNRRRSKGDYTQASNLPDMGCGPIQKGCVEAGEILARTVRLGG